MVKQLTIWLLFLVLSEAAKLPENVVPSKYTITLQTDIDNRQMSFSGKVKIDVNILVPTQKILLNMHGITVSKVDVFNSKSHFIGSDFFLKPPVNEIITIGLDSIIPEGSYTVEMDFKGNFRNGTSGFFSSYLRNDEGLEEFAVVTNCHSGQNCRYIFPCFDEPQFLAKFNVEIKHNKNFVAISNTEIKKRAETMTAYVITSFQETQPISINAFGFAVLNFRQEGPNNVRIKHQVFAERKSVTSGEASTVLNQGDMVIEAFANLLGLPTISKLDQIILPNFVDTPDGYHPCGIMLANLDNNDDELEITKSIATKFSVEAIN
jgi:aminopeptidase N